MKEYKKHIPFHLYLDNQIYFVSSRTQEGNKFFNSTDKLDILKNKLKNAILKHKISLYSWVLLPNHYHLLFTPKDSKILSAFMGYINGGSAYD